jgi:hypothetical protein
MKLSPKFEQACKNQGYDAEKVMPDLSMYPEKHREALAAVAQLFILSDDANKDFEPDYNNNYQRKYSPWVDMETDENNPSGFRFDGAVYVYSGTYADLGSRLVFPNEKATKEFFEENIELYKALLTIPKK